MRWRWARTTSFTVWRDALLRRGLDRQAQSGVVSESIDDTSALAPISAEAPCGPDLDAEGDAEFMNFMAATEGQLPAAFFSFDRKSIDFDAALAGGEKLLARTHDVRLIVLLAKLAILNRDLGGIRASVRRSGATAGRSLGRRPSARRGWRFHRAHRATLDARRCPGRHFSAAIHAAGRDAARWRLDFSRANGRHRRSQAARERNAAQCGGDRQNSC